MSTPPLDLTALRIDVVTASRFEIGSSSHPWSLVDPDHLVEAIDRAIAAEEEVAAVRESLEAHPNACDRHTEDDPIKCGWKRAVADVTRALDSTPYQTLSAEPLVSTHSTPETETP